MKTKESVSKTTTPAGTPPAVGTTPPPTAASTTKLMKKMKQRAPKGGPLVARVPAHRLLKFLELYSALSAADRAKLAEIAADLVKAIEARGERLEDAVVVVMFGGGKDSASVVAKMRAVQLLVEQMYRKTFTLRIATYRHSGMGRAVMANIARVYDALGCVNDPTVELLVVHGDVVTPFSTNMPIPEFVKAADRQSFLMNAHMSCGDGRTSFCNACNLNMTRTFTLVTNYGRPAAVIVTGDSVREQQRYNAWTRRTAHHFGVDDNGNDPNALARTLGRLDRLHGVYAEATEGPGTAPTPVTFNAPPPDFFSLYGYVEYELGAHRALVQNYLDFRFDLEAFWFTESDCANPLIMMTMRALTFERLRGRTYREGLEEYATFALELMARKHIPEDLIETMRTRCFGEGGAEAMREIARGVLRENFGLTEDQVVAALYSPFADAGARLEKWIAAETPAGLGHESVVAVASGAEDEETIAALTAATALSAAQVRHLWASASIPNLSDASAAEHPLSVILKGDPHKAVIQSVGADGETRTETISGR